MPNGGSDCCGTCWFNVKNRGVAGYAYANDPSPSFCSIRQFPIPNPFYTYCANHPHRRPERDPVPIGPVFVGDSEGARTVWKSSPDTEQIRLHLLSLLRDQALQPRPEYPIGSGVDEAVVWQLGEFEEVRALVDLRRIAAFDPSLREPTSFGRTREALVELAHEAIVKIER